MGSLSVLVPTKRFLLLSHRSRRSVTEHQLMHDRSRNIQSLKRLFWLSSAIEGLHTAQSRSAALNPVEVPNLAMNPSLGSAQPAVKSLLRGFFNPYLTQLPEPEAWESRHSAAGPICNSDNHINNSSNNNSNRNNNNGYVFIAVWVTCVDGQRWRNAENVHSLSDSEIRRLKSGEQQAKPLFPHLTWLSGATRCRVLLYLSSLSYDNRWEMSLFWGKTYI